MKTIEPLKNRRIRRLRAGLCCAMSGWLAGSAASAGVKNWLGSVNGNWNTPGNWVENAVPTNGDQLVFSAATRYTITNNITNLRLDRITFSDGGYLVRGNGVTLTNGIVSAPPAAKPGNELEMDVTLGASQTFRCDRTNLYFYGAISLGTNTLTVTNAAATEVTIGAWAGTGLISGTGGITKDGAGTLSFAGWSVANTYTGPTYVKDGTLLLWRVSTPCIPGPGTLTIGDGSGSAGSAVVRYANNDQIGSMPIIINADGLFNLAGLNGTISNSLTLNGGDISLGTGTLTLGSNVTVLSSSSVINGSNGAVNLSATRTFDVADGVLFELQAPLVGAGGLTKKGYGQMRLDCSGTYSGLTTVAQGDLQVWAAGALGSSDSGTVVSNEASLLLGVSGTISNESLTLNGPGFEGSAAFGIGNLAVTSIWTGPVTFNADVPILVLHSSAVLNLRGTVAGNGGLTKTGSGKLILSGTTDNGYMGNTTVASGTLELSKWDLAQAIRYGTLSVGDGAGGKNADILRLGGGSDQINDSVPIVISSSGLLDCDALSETIGPLTLKGGDIWLSYTALSLGGNVTVSASSLITNRIGGWLNLPASRTFNVTNGASLNIAALVSGTGGITKAGAGTLRLGPNNNYDGLTVVQQGLLELAGSEALGSGVQGTVVSNGASLVFVTNATISSELLTLNGPGFTGYGALDSEANPGTNVWGGTVVLNGDCTFAGRGPLTMIRLTWQILGPGSLRMFGSGMLDLSGSQANSYSGITTVESGTLILGRSGTDLAIPGDLLISGAVLLGLSEQIRSNANVTINPSGSFDLGSFYESIGGLSGSGQLKLSGGQLYAGCNNYSGTFSGVISGSGEFHKAGNGTITLTANNTLTGRTYVDSGTLVINGSQPQSQVTIESNGTLGGTGTVGHITANGNLAPGSSPGLLTSSNLTFSSTGDYYVELNGTTAGSGYDQIKVRGTPSLGNAALHVTLGYASSIGNSYVIIDNDGTEPPNGEFAGLPDGATLNIGGNLFRINYRGGSGNDVVLTHIAPPQLQIARTGTTNVVVSWPTNFTGFTLEAKTNVTTTVWAVVSPAPVVVGTNYHVTNPVTGMQKYYRLRTQ